MGENFGAISPSRIYITRMRWMVGLLICLVVVLAGSLLAIAAYFPFEQETQPLRALNSSTEKSTEPKITPAPPVIPNVDVLVSKLRIESGMRIDDSFLEVKSVPETLLPEGVMLASERGSVLGMYAKTMIPAHSLLVNDAVAPDRPANPFDIPKGYRAVAINIDARSGVEGFARPNTRVDVLWLFRDREETPKVSTIVRFARVLSIGGRTNIDGPNGAQDYRTATLLVTERDAKLIELARETGRVSLSLVGDEESTLSESDEVVTISDLTRSQEGINDEKDIQGRFSTVDPRTGRKVELVLTKNRWAGGSEAAGTGETGRGKYGN